MTHSVQMRDPIVPDSLHRIIAPPIVEWHIARLYARPDARNKGEAVRRMTYKRMK